MCISIGFERTLCIATHHCCINFLILRYIFLPMSHYLKLFANINVADFVWVTHNISCSWHITRTYHSEYARYVREYRVKGIIKGFKLNSTDTVSCHYRYKRLIYNKHNLLNGLMLHYYKYVRHRKGLDNQQKIMLLGSKSTYDCVVPAEDWALICLVV